MRKVIALLFIAAAWCGCDEDDQKGPLVADLQAFAFPNTVEPGGEATIAVKVNLEACKSSSACTVCVGMPGGGGHLFAPAGLDVEEGKSIALPADELALNSLVYVAPNREGSEVVSAALFKADVVPADPHRSCADLKSSDLVATTTVRILIKNPPPPEADDDTAGAGGVAGTGGAAPIGGAPPGGSGGAGPIGGDGGTGGTGGAPEGGSGGEAGSPAGVGGN